MRRVMRSKYGSATLLPVKTFISKPAKKEVKVDALADTGSSVLIPSYDFAVKLELMKLETHL